MLAALGCRRDADSARAGRLLVLQQKQERLWAELEQQLAGDEIIQGAVAEEDEVMVVIQGPLLQALLTRVAQRYLDRVELDLKLEAKATATGEVNVKGLNAGAWTLDLVVHRVRGVLAARGPKATIAGGNSVSLRLPVALEGAQGDASLDFAWDSKGVANLVCRDFRIERRLEATIEPSVEVVNGALTLEAGSDGLRAVPAFEDVPYTLKPVPTPESWKIVEDALREQDSFAKCGMALDPETLLPKLRERLAEGFKVRLPRRLFRPFALPTSIRTSLERDGRRLELGASPGDLRFVSGALWYSAHVSVAVETPAPLPKKKAAGA